MLLYHPDQFLNEYIDQALRSRQQLSKEELRTQLQQRLGIVPSPVSIQYQQVEKKECDGYTRERVVFQSTELLDVPVFVLTPHSAESSFPSVLALHGHGNGSRELVGLSTDNKEAEGEPGIHQQFAVQLVKQGMKVFVPEILGFGDRKLKRDTHKGNSCFALAAALMMSGSTLIGMRTFEARRVLDLMSIFQDVQQHKIGLIGFSGGAFVASMTAALDHRIEATMLSGFTNTYQQSILAMDHCIDNYIPSILQTADLAELIGLISPKKLFIEAGLDDPIFPIAGVKDALEQLKTIFQEQGVPDHLAFDLFQGGHTINGIRSLQWMKDALQ